eukprot:CAMPEP_0176445006 /NCGR_PEP_ID=MMETSP0127-20121128/23424_1 /TAXON_ID=938130 /ORGANISM="Platyophrya macrostoma, Strain WH" /LENGTH=748 /DNA_ID=CAMNT_0017830669 /DNA_START=616 /DNA_END=2862 /DNA_ORIENTATION=-
MEIEIQQLFRYGDVLKEIKRYKRILEDIPTGVCIIDQEMVLFANQALKDIVGTSESPEVFKKLLKVKIGSQQENSLSALQPKAQNNNIQTCPLFQVEKVSNESVSFDISRKEVSEEKTKAEKKIEFKSTFEKIDFESTELLQRPEARNSKISVEDLTLPQYFEQVIRGDTERNSRLKVFRTESNRNDDTMKFVNCEYSENENAENKTVLDITTTKFNYKKQNESSLIVVVNDSTYRQQIENLSLSIRYKNSILGYVSHEINTPLNIIIMLLESLKMHLDPALYQQMVIPVRRTTKIMHYVIASMEVYCQLEQGTLPIYPTVQNLRITLDKLVEVFEAQASSKGLSLEIIIRDGSPLHAEFDGKLYEQIIFNLLSNSVKYTVKGLIRIIVSKSECDGKVYLKTEIHDTGIGLNKEQITLLKRKSVLLKTQGMTSLSDTSLGMGLSISQALAALLSPKKSNSFEVKSESGKGSIFTFYVAVKGPTQEVLTREYRRRTTDDIRNSFEVAQLGNLLENFTFRNTPVINGFNDHHPKNNHLNIQFNSGPLPTDNSEGSHNSLPPPLKLHSLKCLHLKRDPTQEFKTQSDSIEEIGQEFSDIVSQNTAFEQKMRLCNCFDILVVDDNDFNHLAVEMLIVGTNLKLHKAKNGQEALDTLETKCKYDRKRCSDCCKMILMDINMPVMDGIQATKLLKAKMKRQEIKYIPVIMNSANSTFNAAEKFEGMQLFDDNLPKPLNRKKFLDIYNQSLTLSI